MKRLPLILLLGATLLLPGLVIFKISQSNREKEATMKEIITLPVFSYMTLNHKQFVSASITRGPVIIMNYHPECEHCRYEINEIVKSSIVESNVKIIFISSAGEDEQRKFLSDSGIEPEGSCIFLTDPAFTFGKIFGSKTVPAIFIYDENLNLIRSFQGEVRIDTIEKTLQESGHS